MSKVEISSSKVYAGEENQILQEFKSHIEALIRKDKAGIEAFLDPSFQLIHMTGTVASKNQYVNDVMTGVLNYYHSKIINPEIEINNDTAKMKVDVNFDAKVYGGKGNWTLHSKNHFKKINNKWYFVKWDNI